MPDIPGFGAITVTLMEEPYVDFRWVGPYVCLWVDGIIKMGA